MRLPMQGISSVYKLPEAADRAAHSQLEKPWYECGPIAKIFGQGAVYQWIKRAIDLAVCVAALPFILPLLGLCCLAIRIDSPGPIFFFSSAPGAAGNGSRCSSSERWCGTRKS